MTNATLNLVRDIGVYFEQSEKTATIEVGVAIGVVVSVCIMLCLCCSAKVCIAAKRGESPVVACCKPSSRERLPRGIRRMRNVWKHTVSSPIPRLYGTATGMAYMQLYAHVYIPYASGM